MKQIPYHFDDPKSVDQMIDNSSVPLELASQKLTEVGLGNQEIDILTGEQAEKKAASFTPQEEAAARFIYLLPYIKKMGNALNQKAVVRVMHALAEFPLNGDKPKFMNKQEEQLFTIFNEIYMTKSVILKHALEQQNKTSATKENQSNDV